MLKRTLGKILFSLATLAIPATMMATPSLSEKSTKSQSIQATKKLSDLIEKRMELSRELAKVKWNRVEPIDDASLEASELQETTQSALQSDMDTKIAEKFCSSQLDASKDIMINQFEHWVTKGLHKHGDALDKEAIAKKIQDIHEQQLALIKELTPQIKDIQEKNRIKAELAENLTKKGMSRSTIDSALSFF